MKMWVEVREYENSTTAVLSLSRLYLNTNCLSSTLYWSTRACARSVPSFRSFIRH